MNQIKTFKVLVIVLAIMNVSLLTVMWFHRPPMGEGPGGRPDDMNRFLVHELKLTEAQHQQFDALFEDHLEKLEPIRKRGRDLHDLLFEQLRNNKNSSDSIITLIATNRAEGEKILFAHLQKVRALCNEQQKNKFDQLIKGGISRMDRP